MAAGQPKVAQPGSDRVSVASPARIGAPASIAAFARSRRTSASASSPADEPSVPSDLPPAVDHRAGSGQGAAGAGDDEAAAGGAAMLHARHHLLADVAALAEIDAGELVHVGVVGEGVAEGEVDAAFGDAERDAVGVVVGFRLPGRSRPSTGGWPAGATIRQPSAASRGSGAATPSMWWTPSGPQTAITWVSAEMSSIVTLARSR